MENKKSKVLIIILIIIIIGLAGFIVYDKFIKKDNQSNVSNTTTNTTTIDTKKNDTIVENKAKEYISFDSSQYLKLNSDNTYELSGKFVMSNDPINKKGTYTKNDNNYVLDGSINVINKGDFVEVENVVFDSHYRVNAILFDKSTINSTENKIKENYRKNLDERFAGYRKNNPNLANVENIEITIKDCFRHSYNGEELSKDGAFTCSSSYDLYLTGYSKEECNSEPSKYSRETATSMKYYDYLISSGGCMENTLRNGGFATINYNDNYKVGCCGSGL